MSLKFFLFFLLLLLFLHVSAGFSSSEPNYFNSLLPSDAVALLSFKSTADLDNKLLYSLTERYDYCQWRGVKCAQGRVVRLVLSGVGLRGYFSSATLSRLDQLRVLSLENNSLFGPVPDLSALVNLKSLFLSRNEFNGPFPPSIPSLHRLMILSLSHNNFTGQIPTQITALDRLTSLNLESNRFNGTLPSLNQSFLTSFNVSVNNLTGVIPVTPTLSRFDASSFKSNPGLCGEIINRACASSRSPFFGSSNNKTSSSSSSSQAPLGQSAQAQNGGAVVISPVVSKKKGKENGLVLGFTVGLASLIVLGLCLVVFSLVIKKQTKDEIYEPSQKGDASSSSQHQNQALSTRAVPVLNPNSNSSSVEKLQFRAAAAATEPQSRVPNSGNLIFCGGGGEGGESSQGMYTLEQLMRASAELLGRGSVGITYKAVFDNLLIVTVKRLDAAKTAVTSEDAFENHMEIVGGLRHQNLVPIRAYFQSNGERLIIFDYQPNGSLFNLIHGSRSSRAKPLHWTSCLKIAEDVAQGLYYIHQTSSALVHGNLKSTNILLGHDFEACLTDYCLSVLTDSSSSNDDDPDSSSYKAPEIRKSSRRPTSKCDVYSFGVLIFELLTGKNASRHPFMAPHDMLDWVRAMREEEEGAEDNRLGMMTETACLGRRVERLTWQG